MNATPQDFMVVLAGTIFELITNYFWSVEIIINSAFYMYFLEELKSTMI